MRPALFIAVVLFCFGIAAQTVIEWDANDEPECIGYRVLSGPATQRYTRTNYVWGRASTNAVVTNLPPGLVYLVVQAVAQEPARDSEFSLEVMTTNAPPALPKLGPPRRVKIISGTIIVQDILP